MTTTEQTRIAEVDPLVLTAAARPGQRLAMIAVDVLLPLALVAIAVALPALGMPGLGCIRSARWRIPVAHPAMRAESS